jgi:hypothetical protein
LLGDANRKTELPSCRSGQRFRPHPRRTDRFVKSYAANGRIVSHSECDSSARDRTGPRERINEVANAI